MIAPSVILPFDGNHADIPSGYTRETTLDGLYPKGSADSTDPNDTGGASTHSHTSDSHTHTINGHSHSVTTSSNNHKTSATQATSNSGSPRNAGRDTHNHSGTISTLASTSISSVEVSYSSQSNDPPYYTVIFIKASGYTTIPENGMVLNSATSRSGMDFHAASANKFLKGANTDADAGDTGGTTTNTHTITHTHTAVHGHTGSSGGPSEVERLRSSSGSIINSYNHTHTITLNTTNLTSGNNSEITDQVETVEPAYRTLNAFKASSSTMPAEGDIAMWLGSLDSIPVGWNLCDGTNDTPDMREKFLKIPSSASATTTGGSNTHTHADQGHTHTLASHNHTGSVAAASNSQGGYPGGAAAWHAGGGSHSLTSISSTETSLVSSNTSANSSSNEPEYRTVAYIQFEFPPVIPNPILGMLIDRL
jgi:hypothetical protein